MVDKGIQFAYLHALSSVLAAENVELRTSLAAAQARADGYALLVGELRAALEAIGERFQEYDVVLRDPRRSQATDMIQHQILGSDLVRASLATAPEARAGELSEAARTEGDADRCAPCQSKVYSGIGPFPWTCQFGHTVYHSGGPLTARHRVKPAQKESAPDVE